MQAIDNILLIEYCVILGCLIIKSAIGDNKCRCIQKLVKKYQKMT